MTPPARRSAAQAEQRAEPGERRAGDDELHQRRRGLLPRVPVGERVGDPAASGPGGRRARRCAASWWATNTTVSAPSGSPASATTLHVVRARQQAAEEVRAAGDVVGDRRGRGEPGGGGRARAPRAGEPGRARRRPPAAPTRDRERAGRPLLLDPRRRAPSAANRSRIHSAAARSPARGRRAVDRLQALDGGAQAGGVGRHRRGRLVRSAPCETPTACSARSSPARSPPRGCARTSARSRSWTSTRPRAATCSSSRASTRRDLLEIGPEDLAACAAAAQELAARGRRRLGADGVNLLNSCGARRGRPSSTSTCT